MLQNHVKSNNPTAFFFFIKIYNRYKICNSFIYDYVFVIELKKFDMLIARRQTH